MNVQGLQASRTPLSTLRLLHLYLWLVMSLLFIQGMGALILRLRPNLEAALPSLLAALLNANIPHAILHIVWGTFGLFVLAFLHQERVRLTLAWTFGVFYTLLGFLGFIINNPLGMRLALPEHLFHLTIGPLMLLLAWRVTSRRRTAMASLNGGRALPQSALPAASLPQQSDRVRWTTRVLSVFIVPFLVLGAGALYLFPDRSPELWAWAIQPRITAMMLGADYLGGIYFFIRAATATRWHSVKIGFLAITAFATLMGVATLLHWDRFSRDRLVFQLWAMLYFTTPFLVPAAWLLNRPADTGTPDALDFVIPASARQLIGLVGAVVLLASALLFLVPQLMLSLWPWNLTPLTARVLGAMFALTGVANVCIARDMRWSAARIILQSQLVVLAFIDVAIVFSWSDLNLANPLTWIEVGGLVLALVGGSMLVYRVDRWRVPTPQTP